MAKVYDTATDLITFARSSSGTALRRVGYGDELVDTANTASAWTPYGTNLIVQDGNTVKISYVDDSKGGFVYLDAAGGLSADMAVGTLYQLTFRAKVNTGSATVQVFNGVSSTLAPITSTSYTTIVVNLVYPSGSRPFINVASNLNSGESIWFDSISVKEVIFDRATDDLVLFDHPDDIPRIEYGSDGSLKGLLIEEQRTNLFPSSNDFTTWAEQTTSGATTGLRYIQENAAIGPDGQTSAHKLVESAGMDQQRIYSFFSGMTANTDYTYSVFLKAGERTEAIIRTTVTNGMLVNLVDGTFTTVVGSNHDVQPMGNGWYRCSFTVNEATTYVVPWVSIANGGVDSYTGDGTSGIYVYGAQFEQGSFATSYIPTSGSQSTRSPDIASIPVSAFGYNQTAGTFVADYTPATQKNQYAISVVRTSSYSDYMALLWGNSGTQVRFQVTAGSATSAQLNTLTGTIAGTQTVHAGAYAANDFAACNDGGAVLTDTLGDVPSGLVKMKIGGEFNQYLNGHIKSIQYYPRRLTDAQLQELTS